MEVIVPNWHKKSILLQNKFELILGVSLNVWKCLILDRREIGQAQ